MMRGPKPRYDALIRDGALEPDGAQADAVDRLQDLYQALRIYCRKRGRWFGPRPDAPRGLYLWGGVGRGKTLLMDLFFNNAELARKRRVHFHEFMAEIHTRVAAWRAAPASTRKRHKGVNKAAPDDPITPVAHDIARDAALLCLDELQVTDITDAMILSRLFEALFAEGIVVVATSNRHPDDLYKDGLIRQLFTPFIDLLKARNDIVELVSDQDYRLAKLAGAPVYYTPLGPEADAAMDAAWRRILSGSREKPDALIVAGRTVRAKRTARGAARFTFAELCEAPLGAADYLAIVRRYGTLFMDHIPVMDPAKRNEARRFVNLIDAVYDARVKFICSAAAAPDALYTAGDGSFEFERTASRLIEMQSTEYLAAPHRQIATDAADGPDKAASAATEKADFA